jgi:murein L,D-transpeptidase YcbB/YkuD
MKITNIIYTAVLSSSLFVGCSSHQVQQDTNVIENKQNNNTNIYTKKVVQVTEEIHKDTNQFLLDSNSKEFLEILKNDKYASLCSSEDKYLSIKNMENSQEKVDLLKDLFYDYTKNLSNSCINQSAFKKKLKQKRYRDISQDYEVYNVDINKSKLLKKYTSNTQSVESILETYTPKHPQFFPLINKLDKSTLGESKYNKLRLNIERLKLLKYSNSDNFIQLNVPSYNFAFYEGGTRTKTFGTVVGSVEAQTPILSSKLAYFIVNPTWNIPDSIAKSSIIPKALKDRNYLKKKNIVIRKNYKLSSKKIKWKDVKWKKYLKKDVRYIPYKFIQLPSRTNGMGRMKFIFPNDYAVYMHDTIGTWRFKSNKQKIRFTSHGCIRLEHPVSLMKYLSENYTKYSYKKVRSIYDKEKTDTIRLNKKLPIHLTYQTVQINNGKLSFHSDVYGYDKIQKLNF